MKNSGLRSNLALLALMAVPVSVACQTVRARPNQSSSVLVGQAQVNPKPSDPAYRVEWEESHVPEVAGTKVTIAVPLTVRNIGNRVWPSSAVFVAYHWLRDGHLVQWDGERTSLPRDLEPGGRVAMSIRVTTPEEPGSYTLQITLVQELVAWFENKGADMITRTVVVRLPIDEGDR